MTDDLPGGTAFVEGVNGNGATVCALKQPGHQVVCDIGSMAPGASETVYITVVVDPSLVDTTVLSNTATVSSTTPDPDPADNTDTETTNVDTAADLWLDKTATQRSGNPAPVVTYTLTVHNNTGCEADAQSTVTPNCGTGGPSDARSIVVTDTLPLTSKKFVVQYISPQCTYTLATHKVVCTAANLPAGATVQFVIEGQVNGSVGTILNTASLTSTTLDPVATKQQQRRLHRREGRDRQAKGRSADGPPLENRLGRCLRICRVIRYQGPLATAWGPSVSCPLQCRNRPPLPSLNRHGRMFCQELAVRAC